MHPNTEQLLNYSLIVHVTDGGVHVDTMACGILYEELRPPSTSDMQPGYYLVATARHHTQTLHRAVSGVRIFVSDAVGNCAGLGVVVLPSVQTDVSFVVLRGQGLPTSPLIRDASDPRPHQLLHSEDALPGLVCFPAPPRKESPLPFISYTVRQQSTQYYKFHLDGTLQHFKGSAYKPGVLLKRGWVEVKQLDLPSRPGCSGGILAGVDSGLWEGMIIGGNGDRDEHMEDGGDALVLTPSQIHAARHEVEPQLQKFLKSLPR